jgi:hypothetical protein
VASVSEIKDSVWLLAERQLWDMACSGKTKEEMLAAITPPWRVCVFPDGRPDYPRVARLLVEHIMERYVRMVAE